MTETEAKNSTIRQIWFTFHIKYVLYLVGVVLWWDHKKCQLVVILFHFQITKTLMMENKHTGHIIQTAKWISFCIADCHQESNEIVEQTIHMYHTWQGHHITMVDSWQNIYNIPSIRLLLVGFSMASYALRMCNTKTVLIRATRFQLKTSISYKQESRPLLSHLLLIWMKFKANKRQLNCIMRLPLFSKTSTAVPFKFGMDK